MRRLIPIYLLLVAAYAANFIDRFFGGKETSQQMAPPQVPAPPIAKSPPPKPEWQKPKLCDDEQYKDVPKLSPPARKLIGFADIHGDSVALAKVLKRAGVFYEQEWHADNTFVVQTGNLVDIGEHDQAVLEKMYEVQTAKARYFFPMMGAHEAKLTAGDFSSSKQLKKMRDLVTGCDGNYNRMIRSWPMVRKVGNVLFAHGGMSLYWAEEFQKRCQGEGKTGPTGYALVKCINMLQAEYMAKLCSKEIQPDDRSYAYMQSYRKGYKDINTEKMGPLWYKGYGSFEPNPNRAASMGEDEICESVKKMLKLFHCEVHVIAARSWLMERQSEMSKVISFCGGAFLKTDFEMSNFKRVREIPQPRVTNQIRYNYDVPAAGSRLSWYEFIHGEETVTFNVEQYSQESTRTSIIIKLPSAISLYTADEEGGASVWNQDEANRDSVCQGASEPA